MPYAPLVYGNTLAESHSSNIDSGPQDAEAMHSTLESVYQILLAKGTLRQKRSRPFRAHIEAYSPRAALVLPGPVVNGQRLPLCTVSLTQLSCKVLAGSQTSRQLHSGSGAVFTQVCQSSALEFALLQTCFWVLGAFGVGQGL